MKRLLGLHICKVIVYLIIITAVLIGSISVSYAEDVNEIDQVTGLYVHGNGVDSIELSWNPVTDATGYNIYRAKSDYNGGGEIIEESDDGTVLRAPKTCEALTESDFEIICSVEGGNTTEYKDSAVKKGDYEIYHYMVQAVYRDGDTVINGMRTPAQPGIVKLTGSDTNAFPVIDYNIIDSQVYCPGYCNIDFEARNIDSSYSKYFRGFEISCDDGTDIETEGYADISNNMTELHKTVEIFIKGDNKLSNAHLLGTRTMTSISLRLKFNSELGEAAGMRIQYPVWNYCDDTQFEVVDEFNTGFIAKLTDSDLAEKLSLMEDGETAILKTNGNWGSKLILKKEYLDVIKNTDKSILVRLNMGEGGGIDWIFYGKDITTVKDINVGVMPHIDSGTDYGADYIYWLEFYDNGKLPENTEIRFFKATLNEMTESAYSDWINSLNESDRIFVYNLTDGTTTVSYETDATMKNGWIYLNIDHNSTFGFSNEELSNYINKQQIYLSSTRYAYDGKVKKPSVTIRSGSNKLVEGSDYTLLYQSGRKNMGKYKITIKGKNKYTGTKNVYFTIGPKAPSEVNAELYGYDDIVLSWSKVDGASGYAVYYKKAAAKDYSYLGTTKSRTYKKADLSDGLKYSFRIIPYKTINNVKCYGASRSATVYTLKKIQSVKVTRYSSSKVKISWGNINGESGYQISKSTSKNGTYIAGTYKTTTGNSKVISASKGKNYYYKVRAYKTSGNKKIYGPWSEAVAYRIK